jgi:GTPase
MVMVSPVLDPQCCYEFEGEILVLHHPTTISTKYQVQRQRNHIKVQQQK